MTRRLLGARLSAVLSAVLSLAGCAGFAEGITRAVLSPAEQALDTRSCTIEGPGFLGLLPALERQDGHGTLSAAAADRPILKTLIVHGIGTHEPGYAATLDANLSHALALDVSAPGAKTLTLIDPAFPGRNLGVLRVTRHSDAARTREMLFYELTWSGISKPARQAIAFDDTVTFTRQRAALNRTAKRFVNDVAPDPLVYVGVGHEPILAAVSQSICWMIRSVWDDLPDEPRHCSLATVGPADRLLVDDLAFFSHSLGSRIVLDALQRMPRQVARLREEPRAQALLAAMRERSFPVFMLSNQLPLLQAGFAPPEVSGAIEQICLPDAPRAAERLWGSLKLVAFSDPNDLVSYPVPDPFVQSEVDSRLCPVVTNVTLNVAPVRAVLNSVEFANPLDAHSNYSADDRVIALIARGVGQPWSDPIVAERCTLQETAEDLR